MVINDLKIKEWARSGGIFPFVEENVNPASIDLCWSGRYRIARKSGWTDVRDCESLSLDAGELYLMDTLEVMTLPRNWVGMLALKSSMGRIGLEHLHAGFVDPEFSDATLTLEIKNLAPWAIELKKGQRLVQLVFMECYDPERSYKETGRYNGQKVPEKVR